MTDTQDNLQKLEEIRNKFNEGMGINRIPQKTRERFLEFTMTDFCDDRGLALKFLMDFYDGLIPKGWEHLEIALEDLNNRLTNLEQKFNEKKETVNTITMANGRLLRLKDLVTKKEGEE